MEQFLLFSHIIGAIMSLTCIIFVTISSIKMDENSLKLERKFLFVNFIFQIISGGLLSLGRHASLLVTCQKLGLYLILFAITQAVIVVSLTNATKNSVSQS